MESDTPSVISLFAGAGGLDIGLEQAGFRTVSAVDVDPDCLATLQMNQRARHRLTGKRHHLAGTMLLHADIECYRAWLLDGGDGDGPADAARAIEFWI